MKTLLSLMAAGITALSPTMFAADAPAGCCEKPKPAPAPAASSGCCCCAKMDKANAATVGKQTAKSDETLEALVAILNKLIQEHKAAQATPDVDAAPQEHQH